MMYTRNFFALGLLSLGVVRAQTTVVVNGTASHTIPSTLCEFSKGPGVERALTQLFLKGV